MYRVVLIVLLVICGGCSTVSDRPADPVAALLDSELRVETNLSNNVASKATLDTRLYFDWTGDGATMLRYLNDLLGYRFDSQGRSTTVVVRVKGVMSVEDAFVLIGEQMGDRGTVFVDENLRETRLVFETSSNFLTTWWRRVRS